MKEKFVDKVFRRSSLDIIAKANEIIAEYQAMGFTLTLRQLYYQFVSRDIIPNQQAAYKRLGEIVNNGRLAGLIDWSAIEDRTRNLRSIPSWGSPEGLMEAAASQYREALWADQPYMPEVWIEKDALVGVIEPVCNRNRVPYFACRGYVSQSEAYAAGKRFEKAARYRRKRPIIFHLGDHDPSGIDMSRDIDERLSMFASLGVQVVRLALNMDQVEQYGPPPNPAKDTDARFDDYRRRFGDESWELDALDPPVIDALIQKALDGIIDQFAWSASKDAEEKNRQNIERVYSNWSDVIAWLDERAA